MTEPATQPHLFADVLSRVLTVCRTLTEQGVLPAGLDLSRIVVEPPRDTAHGDMATNAAMVLAKDAKAKPRDLAERIAELLRADPLVEAVEMAGPGFINLTLKASVWPAVLAAVLRDGVVWPHQRRPWREDQRRVCLRQSDRADACRPLPRRGVRRCAREPAAVRGLRRDARVLHQRCRRAGRRARALGVPALPRGAGREHRRDSGRPLSGRLSEAGRAGARRRAWRQAHAA